MFELNDIPWTAVRLAIAVLVVIYTSVLGYWSMRNPAVRVTDVGWFWAFMFSGMAIICALLVSPRYIERQERIESRYEARNRVAAYAENADQLSPVVAEQQREVAAAAEMFEAQKRQRWSMIVLGGVLAIAYLTSAVFLVRHVVRQSKVLTSVAADGTENLRTIPNSQG